MRALLPVLAATLLAGASAASEVVRAPALPEGAVAQLGYLPFDLGSLPAVLAADPNGERVAAVGPDQVTLLDAATGKFLLGFPTPTKIPRAALLVDSGSALLVGSYPGRLVEAAASGSGTTADLDAGQGHLHALAPGPHGRLVASGGQKTGATHGADGASTLVIRSRRDLAPLVRADLPGGGVHAAAFSPSGKRVVVATRDHRLRVLDAATGARVAEFGGPDLAETLDAIESSTHQRVRFTACHFGASDDDVVGLVAGRAVVAFSVERGQLTGILNLTSGGRVLLPLGDGLRVITDQGELVRANLGTGEIETRYSGSLNHARRVLLTEGGKTLLGSGDGGPLRAWDVETGERAPRPGEVAGALEVLAVNAEGTAVAAGDHDGVRVYSAATGEVRWGPVSIGAMVQALAFDAAGEGLVVGASSGPLRVLSARSGAELLRYPGGEGREDVVWAGHAAATGSVLALTRGGRLLAWGADMSAEPRLVAEVPGRAAAGALDPGGKLAAIATRAGELRVLELESGRERARARFPFKVRSLAFSPDGRIVLAGGHRANKMAGARVADGRLLRPLDLGPDEKRHPGHPAIGKHAGVWHVAFSADGRRVFARSPGYPIQLWRIRGAERIGEIWNSATGSGEAFAVLGGGARVVGGDGKRALVWSTDAEYRY